MPQSIILPLNTKRKCFLSYFESYILKQLPLYENEVLLKFKPYTILQKCKGSDTSWQKKSLSETVVHRWPNCGFQDEYGSTFLKGGTTVTTVPHHRQQALAGWRAAANVGLPGRCWPEQQGCLRCPAPSLLCLWPAPIPSSSCDGTKTFHLQL